MNPLDDGAFEAAGCQQVGNGAAMAEGVDAPARLRNVIEIRLHPLMALDELVEHREKVAVGLVRHHPTAGGDLEPTLLDQLLQSPLPRRVSLLPPHVQVADLRPHERHVLELRHFSGRQVNDLPRVGLEVIDERLEPARVVVRVRRDDDFEWVAVRILHELLVARLEVLVPIFLRLHPVGLEFEFGKNIFGVDVGVRLFQHRALVPVANVTIVEVLADTFRSLRLFTAL